MRDQSNLERTSVARSQSSSSCWMLAIALLVLPRVAHAGGTMPPDTLAPLVQITRPAEGALQGRGTLTVEATASDTTSVARVDFYIDTILVGSSTSSPYRVSVAGSTLAEGSHVVWAQAVDPAGNRGTSAAVRITVDLQYPTVQISVPTAGTTITTRRQVVRATTTDDHGPVTVSYGIARQSSAWQIDAWYFTGGGNQPPHQATLRIPPGQFLPNGSYYLYARASDAAGNETNWTSAVPITINIPTRETTAPTVTLARSWGDPFTLTATVSDNIGVTVVEFYDNGTLLAEDRTAPYSTSVQFASLSVGAHRFMALAYDAAGNQSLAAILDLTVDPPWQPQPDVAPTVRLTAPTTQALGSGTFPVTAEASDDRGVAKVEFYRGTVLLAADTTAPYSATLDTRPLPDGAYLIWAMAYDTAGKTGNAPPLSITVGDTSPPTVSITSPGSNARISGRVNVIANAQDNRGLVRAEFFLNGSLKVGEVTQGQQARFPDDGSRRFTLEVDTSLLAPASYTLTVKVYDTANLSATSAPVTVQVDPINDTQPPRSLSLRYDVFEDSVEGGELWLQASARDDGGTDTGVAVFEFYNDTELLEIKELDPPKLQGSASFQLDTRRYAAGTVLRLWFKVYDAMGNVSSFNPPKVVTVFNASHALPTGCRSSGATVICSTHFDYAAYQGPGGLRGWGLMTRNADGSTGRPLEWQALTHEWTDPQGPSQTKENRYGLYSDPSAPLRITWTPPESAASGIARLSVRAYDFTRTCGTGAMLALGTATQPAQQQLTVAPSGTAVYGVYTYPLERGNRLLIDVSGANAVCDAVRVSGTGRLSVLYTTQNYPPVLRIDNGQTSRSTSLVLHPGTREVVARLAFLADDPDEGPERLTYRCTRNGVAFTCGITGRAQHRDLPTMTFEAGSHTVRVTAVDGGGLLSNTIEWQLHVESKCGNSLVDVHEQCDRGGQNGQPGAVCTASCQWATPEPGRHATCTTYSLPSGHDWNDPLPATGGTYEVVNLVSLPADGGALRWRDDAYPGRRGVRLANVGVACDADIVVNFDERHYAMVIGSAGAGRVTVDGQRYLDNISPSQARPIRPTFKASPLSRGTHRVQLDYRYYGNTFQTPPSWFYLGWIPVGQDRWVGMKWPVVDGTIYHEPQVVEPQPGEPLIIPATDEPAFGAFYAGNFAWPQGGLYAFDADVADQLLVYRAAFNTELNGWVAARRFTAKGLYPTVYDKVPGDYEVLPGNRLTLYTRHLSDGGPAHVQLQWHRDQDGVPGLDPVCGNSQVEPPETCDPPGRTCSATCQAVNPPPDCDNGYCEQGENATSCPADCGPGAPAARCGNRICEASETAASCSTDCGPGAPTIQCGNGQCERTETAGNCASDCGPSAPRASEVNNNANYSIVTADQVRLAPGRIVMPIGGPPHCDSSLVVTKTDSTTDPLNPVARDQGVMVDGSGQAFDMEQVWCDQPGVHEVRSTSPGNGMITEYSVCVGCRFHTRYVRGSTAQVYVPPGSYASVRFSYRDPATRYRQELSTVNYGGLSGVGGGASAAQQSAGATAAAPPVPEQIIDIYPPEVAPAGGDSSGVDGTEVSTSLFGGAGTGAAAALGTGAAVVDDGVAGWAQRPRFSLNAGTFERTPVTVWNLYAVPQFTNPPVCHVPSCFTPGCFQPTHCLTATSTSHVTMADMMRKVNQDHFRLQEVGPEEADLHFLDGTVVQGRLRDANGQPTGERKYFLNPTPGLLAGITTEPLDMGLSPRASFSHIVDAPDGDFLKRADILNANIQRSLIWLNLLQQPAYAEVLGRPFSCDVLRDPARSTCAQVTEWMTDLQTTDDDVPVFVDGWFNGVGLALDTWVAGLLSKNVRDIPSIELIFTRDKMLTLHINERVPGDVDRAIRDHNLWR